MNFFRLIFSLFFVFTSALSFAQQVKYYPDSSDHWTLTRFHVEDFTETAVTDSYSVASSVYVCGKKYAVLLRNKQIFGYFRSDSTVLWARKSQDCSESEIKLFDFNLKPLDTVIIKPAFTFGDVEKFAVVLSVIPAEESPSGRKEITFQTLYQRHADGHIAHSGPWLNWVAGIGSLEQTFYALDADYLDAVAMVGSDRHYLTCFNDSLVLKFTKTPGLTLPYKGDSCAYHYRLQLNGVGEEPQILESMFRFENPASEATFFDVNEPLKEKYWLNVFNLQGVLIRKIHLLPATNRFSAFNSSDSDGIYFLTLHREDETFISATKIWLRKN